MAHDAVSIETPRGWHKWQVQCSTASPHTVWPLIWGFGCRPSVHMVIASSEPTPNWSTVQVMGYGNTFSTFLLYLRYAGNLSEFSKVSNQSCRIAERI